MNRYSIILIGLLLQLFQIISCEFPRPVKSHEVTTSTYSHTLKRDSIKSIVVNPVDSNVKISGKFSIDAFINKEGIIYDSKFIQLVIYINQELIFDYRKNRKENTAFSMESTEYKYLLDSINKYVYSLEVKKITK